MSNTILATMEIITIKVMEENTSILMAGQILLLTITLVSRFSDRIITLARVRMETNPIITRKHSSLLVQNTASDISRLLTRGKTVISCKSSPTKHSRVTMNVAMVEIQVIPVSAGQEPAHLVVLQVKASKGHTAHVEISSVMTTVIVVINA